MRNIALVLGASFVRLALAAGGTPPAATPVPAGGADPDTIALRDPNPTGRLIRPRHGQTPARQLADERACYAAACAATGWDPYAAYDELVAAGYAAALDDADCAAGLVSVAADGAVTGTVAGDLLDDAEHGAEIGAAVAVAAAVVRGDYLLRPDDPAARRAISRFERDLKTWEREYAACLRPKGYRVRSF